MLDLQSFRGLNPSLTLDNVVELFGKISSLSQTSNQTTSMFLDRASLQKCLEEGEVKGAGDLLDSLGDGDVIYTPAVVSFLQAAASAEKKVFALIIVDVQNDFISGSLAVNNGADVVPVINKLGPQFGHIYKTADWHPQDHVSFHANVKSGAHPTTPNSPVAGPDSNLFDSVLVAGPPSLTQTLWPVHCVQGSSGAELHPDLLSFPGEIRVNKGMNTKVDSYSGFWDNGDTSHTPLYSMLVAAGVTDVVACGIATDYCVGFTALDAARHAFKVYVVEEAIRGVAPGTSAAMTSRCEKAGISFVSSATIPGILAGDEKEEGWVERIETAKQHFMNLERQ